MEISRWSFDKINSISDRYRNFREFLAEVLEGNRSLVAATNEARTQAPVFEVLDDIENLKALPVPEKTRPTARKANAQAFAALAPYFEAGFLLHVSPEAAQTSQILDSMFLYGKVFVPPVNEAPIVEMRLPNFYAATAKNRIYRGRVGSVLKVFRLESLSGLDESSAFAFMPYASGAVFVLICNRPHLWQVSALEAAARLVGDALLSKVATTNTGVGGPAPRRGT